MDLTYPGVYVQEISGGVRPLSPAGTSTAAFVGLTEMGPVTGAQLVTSWTEFQRLFGGFLADGCLPHSVYQFFSGGGRMCYVVRVTRPDPVASSVTLRNRASTPVDGLTLAAFSPGAWGNALVARVDEGTRDPGNEFRLSIGRQADPGAVSATFADATPLEVYDNLSMDPASPRYAVDVLARQSAFVVATVPAANTGSGRGTHRGGPGPLLPLGARLGLRVNVDGDGFQLVTLPTSAGAATASAADVAADVQTAVRALAPLRAGTPAAAFSGFSCSAAGTGDQARLVLASGTTRDASSVRVQPASSGDAATQLRLGDAGGGLSSDGIAVRRPAAANVVALGDAAIVGAVTAVKAGSDGSVDPADALTEAGFAAAFARLDAVTDASLLAVPGEGTPAMMDLGTGYCANRPLQDMFYLGEMAEHDETVAEVQVFRSALSSANSYGALYFPWVTVIDPAGTSRTQKALPPSGFVAGLYARTDAARGVWKAPAGTAASLSGAVGLTAELTDVQQGVLNPIGVDVIRRLPGVGIVVFGARTVSADPQWSYVPVRRTAIMLRTSIYYGIGWAVFEPNDEPLWSQLRLNIGSFMTTLFRQGAFQGATPADAFFVKCDGETTTQADIDQGIVNVLVGFAPLRPAEFVVVRISQLAGQASG